MKGINSVLVSLMLTVCSCGMDNCGAVAHLQRQDWAPDVRKALNDFMDDCSGKDNAYVVFDFDNTCSIFDVEEQLAVYQLETMSFALDPEQLARVIATSLDKAPEESRDFVDDIVSAYSALYSKYGPFTPSGLDSSSIQTVQSDPQWLEFAAKMRLMYDKVGKWTTLDESYNWILYWFCGMNGKQVYDMAYASCQKYKEVETSVQTWTSPSELPSKVGQVSVTWNRGIQVTENIRELWKCLDNNGIDVWVCSASGLEQIKAAVDAFGLRDFCTGILAMTISRDDAGNYTNSYDYSTGYASLPDGDGWTSGELATRVQTAGPGKVTSILNSIAPLYNGATPLAGFMDSTGDFNFCTEFSSLRTVVCFNRADRRVSDGGGLIAEVAVYEKETLGYDYASAVKAGDTLYLLQGRDENGLRTFRSSNRTLRFGASRDALFANADNEDQLAEMIHENLSVGQAVNRYSVNFLQDYDGYHSK